MTKEITGMQIPMDINVCAHKLGVTREALYWHIAQGNLRTYKLGKIHLVDPNHFELFRSKHYPDRRANR
jgi:hypothetical protein